MTLMRGRKIPPSSGRLAGTRFESRERGKTRRRGAEGDAYWTNSAVSNWP